MVQHRPSGFIAPCLPSKVVPPSGALRVHEIKHDGYRLMVWRDGERVRLFTRRGYDWSERYPRIVECTPNCLDGKASRGIAVEPSALSGVVHTDDGGGASARCQWVSDQFSSATTPR